MNVNSQTATTLAADAVDRIIQLDAILGLADQDDRTELQERIAQIDREEFKNILALFGVKSAPAEAATIEAATKE